MHHSVHHSEGGRADSEAVPLSQLPREHHPVSRTLLRVKNATGALHSMQHIFRLEGEIHSHAFRYDSDVRDISRRDGACGGEYLGVPWGHPPAIRSQRVCHARIRSFGPCKACEGALVEQAFVGKARFRLPDSLSPGKPERGGASDPRLPPESPRPGA